MHELILEHGPQTADDVVALANRLSIDSTGFAECLDRSPVPAERIKADALKAAELQFSGASGRSRRLFLRCDHSSRWRAELSTVALVAFAVGSGFPHGGR